MNIHELFDFLNALHDEKKLSGYYSILQLEIEIIYSLK